MTRWGNFEEHPRGSRMYRFRRRIAGRLVTLATRIPDYAAEAAASEQVPRGRVVYFLRAGLLVKIGWSDDVEARKRHLEAIRGEPLELVCTLPGGRCLEHALHTSLDEYRVAGEWFHCCGRVAKLMSGARAAALVMGGEP